MNARVLVGSRSEPPKRSALDIFQLLQSVLCGLRIGLRLQEKRELYLLFSYNTSQLGERETAAATGRASEYFDLPGIVQLLGAKAQQSSVGIEVYSIRYDICGVTTVNTSKG